MPERPLSDAELLGRAAAGDEGAFTDLYRRRQAGLYRFAFQMSGSGAVAEDVVQEVFLALIRGTARYDAARGSVAAFLYGIARNKVLRALECDAGVDSAEGSDFVAVGDLAGDVVRNRLAETVRDAVLALPVHYREAVVLCDLQELEYADAAEALGCAVGTVRSRLHRARTLLAERLRGVHGPVPAAAGLVRCTCRSGNWKA